MGKNFVPGEVSINGWSHIYLRDRQTGTTSRVSLASDGTPGNDLSGSPEISGDGRYIAFSSMADNLVPNDTNGVRDIFVRDRLLNGRSADLRVSQSQSTVKGAEFSYTVNIVNAGPDAATDATLTDLLPANAQPLSITPLQGSCSMARLAVCRLGTVRAGSATKVTVKLKALPIGSIANTVWLNAAPRDPAPQTNSSVYRTRVEE